MNPKQEKDIVGIVNKSHSVLTICDKSACRRPTEDGEVIPWDQLAVSLTQRGYRPQIDWVILHNSIQRFQPTNLAYLFADMEKLSSIDNLGALDVSKATSIRSMFQNCKGLIELDLHTFDTSNVADMRDLFRGCTSLLDLYLSPKFEIGFTDDNYSETQHMFTDCQDNALIHLMDAKRDSRGVPYWNEIQTIRLQDFQNNLASTLEQEVQNGKAQA